jgi:hypothetical protein
VTSDEMLNNDLTAITNWAKIWLLDFNLTKCESITFSVKIAPSNTSNIRFLNTIIKEVACHKHLGININSKMNWANCLTVTCSISSDGTHKKLNTIKRKRERKHFLHENEFIDTVLYRVHVY